MSVTTYIALPQASGEAPEHPQRNFWLGVVNGVRTSRYTVMISTQPVVAWFLSELADFGFELLFAISLMAGLLAAIMSLTLEEPKAPSKPAFLRGFDTFKRRRRPCKRISY